MMIDDYRDDLRDLPFDRLEDLLERPFSCGIDKVISMASRCPETVSTHFRRAMRFTWGRSLRPPRGGGSPDRIYSSIYCRRPLCLAVRHHRRRCSTEELCGTVRRRSLCRACHSRHRLGSTRLPLCRRSGELMILGGIALLCYSDGGVLSAEKGPISQALPLKFCQTHSGECKNRDGPWSSPFLRRHTSATISCIRKR